MVTSNTRPSPETTSRPTAWCSICSMQTSKAPRICCTVLKRTAEYRYSRPRLVEISLCDSGHFFNPGNVAFEASSAEIAGNVFLTTAEVSQNAVAHGGSVKVNGLMYFRGARVGSAFLVDQAIFSGSAGEPHGLSAAGMNVHGLFLWRDVTLENGGQLDLSGASLAYISDQSRSWPTPGNLLIDGLTYSGFQSPEPGDARGDAATRLRWIGLQSGFHPQPDRQLAKVLRESGDDSGAVRVLIAEQDARYQKSSLPRRLLAGFLKTTIGYGHQPLLAILWSALVVLLGWQIVSVGARAGVMAPDMAREQAGRSAEAIREAKSSALLAGCLCALR